MDTKTERLAILERVADSYLNTALDCARREFPHMPSYVATGPDDHRSHRAFHPAFYGSFDWHSCVEMHWVAIRLIRLFPALPGASRARAVLDELLTSDNLATEVAFFRNDNHKSLERPYGWGWLLTLQAELETWDDPHALRWATAVRQLADWLSAQIYRWLPNLSYPQRVGMHANTAFGLLRTLDFADLRAIEGDRTLRNAIEAAVDRFFIADIDYPAHYEPSGADFLSPALSEAEFVGRVIPTPVFSNWLTAFLPGLIDGNPETLFSPAIVTDQSDGQIAHLAGLNLSRAASSIHIADLLPAGDGRIPVLATSAREHADASLGLVTGEDYMVEHWLAAYATLLLT